MEEKTELTDAELIELFSDLIPAPTKVHIVVPNYEGAISILTGETSSKKELLFTKGALVVGVGSETTKRFTEENEFGPFSTLLPGDRVFVAGHVQPEWKVDREGYEMIVVDAGYISTYSYGEVNR